MILKKGYQVLVKAYHKQIVPKHTKIFENIEQATAYKDIITKEVIWNSAVNVEIVEIYYVDDSINKFMLSGQFIATE